jgi:regulatory protein
MNKENTLKYLYRLISQREYLEKTLIDKLYKKGVSKSVIEKSISRLKEFGYIDDKSFIKSFIKSSISKYNGPRRIKNKLFTLGANSNEVDLLLDEIYTSDLIYENIKTLLIKKSKKESDRNKVIAYCSRRGFSVNDILFVESQLTLDIR